MGSKGVKELSNGHTAERSNTRDVFFFAHTRTASHVLCRLLSDQPGWVQSNYHFFHAFNFARDTFGWDPLKTVSSQDRNTFEELLQNGFDEIQRVRKSAHNENKALFLKEHTFYIWEPSRLMQSMWGGPMKQDPFTVVDDTTSTTSPNRESTNPTIFPDRFLKSWRPIYLVRHPALSFESWYRAESGARHVDIFDKQWAFYTTFEYSRQLHDWYLSNTTDPNSMPIVIEADDMMEESSTIETLCSLLNMDTQHILKEWNVIEAPDNAKCRELKFMSGYWNSTTVDKSKSSRGLDLDAKRRLWQVEFGSDVANELWRLVEKAMPDYEYLKSKKI